jgi:hypothetical protein
MNDKYNNSHAQSKLGPQYCIRKNSWLAKWINLKEVGKISADPGHQLINE